MTDFEPFRNEFLERIAEIVWCTLTSVAPDGRPRSRILHPVWELIDGSPVGWVMSTKTPLKAAHLATNPNVAVQYWSPSQNAISIQAVASWVEDPATKQHVWDLFASTPPPLGYDPSPYGSIDNPEFNPLRLDPDLVQLIRGKDVWEGRFSGRIWRRASPGSR